MRENFSSVGARNVLVSMGALGMLLLTEDARAFFAEGVKGEAANTVGAGDSAVAGFLAGWEQSHDWEKALRLAAAAGTATAFTLWNGRWRGDPQGGRTDTDSYVRGS